MKELTKTQKRMDGARSFETGIPPKIKVAKPDPEDIVVDEKWV